MDWNALLISMEFKADTNESLTPILMRRWALYQELLLQPEQAQQPHLVTGMGETTCMCLMGLALPKQPDLFSKPSQNHLQMVQASINHLVEYNGKRNYTHGPPCSRLLQNFDQARQRVPQPIFAQTFSRRRAIHPKFGKR